MKFRTRIRPRHGIVALSALTLTLSLSAAAVAQDSDPGVPPTKPLTPPTPPATQPAEKPATQPAKDLPEADKIIDESVQALGPKEKVDAVTSIGVVANIDSPMGPVKMVMKSDDANRFHIVQSVANMTMTHGSDGKIGWTLNPMMPDGVSLMENEQLEQTAQGFHLLMLWPLLDPREQFASFETLDQTEFNGEQCYKVRLVGKAKNALEQAGYFSVADKLFKGIEITQQSQFGEMKTGFAFADWKEIDGLNVPTTINLDQMGSVTPVSLTDIEFNKVDPETFALPDEVKAALEKRDKPAETQPAETSPSVPPATRP